MSLRMSGCVIKIGGSYILPMTSLTVDVLKLRFTHKTGDCYGEAC